MFNRKKQQIAIGIVALILMADFIWFGYFPLYKTRAAIKQTKAALNLAISRGTAGSRQLPVLADQLQQLQQTASKYEANLPVERSLGIFLQQIANLMTEHNLSEQMIVPGIELRANDLSCIPINMQCKGKLKQIFKFYQRLQMLDRLVRIEQVKLVNDENFSGDVNMETKGVIYYKSGVQSDKEPQGESKKV
jgi:Tfp pilus assembly protein PilO